MASILYRFTRRPHTIGDYLHLAARKHPDSLKLELSVDEFVSEYDQLTRFSALLIWSFAGQTMRSLPVVEAVRPDDSPDRRASALLNANRKLTGLIDGLEALGYTVANGSARFTEEMLADASLAGIW